ncbi:MAG TPA: helix-turn-helix domain-containing protein [Acidimicrobiales bacterium]
MAVLELLARHPDERFSLSEVARRCRLNKATAHALLTTLAGRGILLRHPDDKRYSLGPRLIAIGDAARRGYTAADFAPGVLHDLAAGTRLWARAWQVTGDRLVCVAQAADRSPPAPSRPDATSPLAHLPLVPPVGAAAMAWADPPTVEAWLARAGSTDAVRAALAALPGIRERGVAVTLGSSEWRDLANGRLGSAPPDDPAGRRALASAVARQALLVVDLDVAPGAPVAEVAAPVFDAAGEVGLVLSVTTSPGEEVPTTGVRALARRVREAADGLTTAACGRRPDLAT